MYCQKLFSSGTVKKYYLGKMLQKRDVYLVLTGKKHTVLKCNSIWKNHARSKIQEIQLPPQNAVQTFTDTVADPGFLERGFVCIKVLGVHFADFISFFQKYPMKMKNFGLSISFS